MATSSVEQLPPAPPDITMPPLQQSSSKPSMHEDKGSIAGTSVSFTTESMFSRHEKARVRRGLQSRHLQMISLAGMIGTGLFLSSGAALASAGPVGALIGYTFMAFVTGAVATTSGEMSAFMPVSGGFVRHTTAFVDRTLGVTTGWNFWYSMAITQAVEIIAASSLMAYWLPNVHPAVWISVFWFLIVAINLLPVNIYGETEFFFATIKITLILGLIITGVLIDVGAVPGQERLGFRYWKNPGPFQPLAYAGGTIPGATGKFLATWATLINAAFAFNNVQIVGMAGAESVDPRRAIPKAVRRTFIRLCVFYVLTIFVIGLILPSNAKALTESTGTASSAPFVIAFKAAGIKVLPGIVNAVVMTSAFSSGVSCIFISSRTLLGLANDNMAHRVFLTTNRFGTPFVAILTTALLGSAAYLSVSYRAMQALLWLLNLSAVSGLISAVVLCFAYIRMHAGMKAQGYNRDELSYRSWGQPYVAWFAMICSAVIVFFSGFQVFLKGNFTVAGFFTNYISVILFAVVYLVVKIYHGNWTRWCIPADQIQLAVEFDSLRAERAEEGMNHSALVVNEGEKSATSPQLDAPAVDARTRGQMMMIAVWNAVF